GRQTARRTAVARPAPRRWFPVAAIDLRPPRPRLRHPGARQHQPARFRHDQLPVDPARRRRFQFQRALPRRADLMKGLPRLLLVLFALQLSACAHLSREQKLQASDYAEHARSSAITCPSEGCVLPSPLLDLGDAAYARTTPAAPSHAVILLDHGQDSL